MARELYILEEDEKVTCGNRQSRNARNTGVCLALGAPGVSRSPATWVPQSELWLTSVWLVEAVSAQSSWAWTCTALEDRDQL